MYRDDSEEFVKHINACRDRQEQAQPKRKNKPLIVASNKGIIEGLLNHYNEVSHRDVVSKLGPVKNRLTSYDLTPKEMRLFFRSRFIIGQRASFGMAIRNGETGHVTLSYNMYVACEDYTFFIPLDMKRRYLSKVGEVVDNLDKIIDTAASVEVDQILLNTPKRVFLSLLSDKKYDKLKEKINEQRASINSDELVSYLFTLRGERGYKTATTKALDVIFDKAFFVSIGEHYAYT
jgi:hypothetical protein